MPDPPPPKCHLRDTVFLILEESLLSYPKMETIYQRSLYQSLLLYNVEKKILSYFSVAAR